MQKVILGTETDGIICTFEVDSNNKFVGFSSIKQYIFGVEMDIYPICDPLLKAQLRNKCMDEYNRKQKYKRLEIAFMERLNETVICTNERAYEQLIWEFAKKTETDDTMNDLNN